MKPFKERTRGKILAQNLQFQMELKRCSRNELAQALQIPYSTLSEWISGRVVPRLDKLQQMADYFGCSVSDLIESTENVDPIKVRVLGSPDSQEAIDFLYERYDVMLDSPVFGLVIHGDGMAPDICDGDTVIVRRQKDSYTDLKTGDVAIVKVNGDFVCKELLFYRDEITLISRNQKYKSTTYTQKDIEDGTLELCGRVIELRRKIGQ